MKTDEEKANRAAYMREWRASNKEKVNAQVKERLNKLKESPDAYKKFRDGRNSANRKWADKNTEYLKAKWTKRNRDIYTPELGKVLRKKYGIKYSTQVSMKSARARADAKALPFNLTPEWYETEFAKGCAVTGLPLDPNGSKTPWTAHVDRIIPELGYVQSNCRLVCACYNLAKKNWDDGDVLRMATALLAKSGAM